MQFLAVNTNGHFMDVVQFYLSREHQLYYWLKYCPRLFEYSLSKPYIVMHPNPFCNPFIVMHQLPHDLTVTTLTSIKYLDLLYTRINMIIKAA